MPSRYTIDACLGNEHSQVRLPERLVGQDAETLSHAPYGEYRRSVYVFNLEAKPRTMWKLPAPFQIALIAAVVVASGVGMLSFTMYLVCT